jgi:hypothetical protein
MPLVQVGPPSVSGHEQTSFSFIHSRVRLLRSGSSRVHGTARLRSLTQSRGGDDPSAPIRRISRLPTVSSYHHRYLIMHTGHHTDLISTRQMGYWFNYKYIVSTATILYFITFIVRVSTSGQSQSSGIGWMSFFISLFLLVVTFQLRQIVRARFAIPVSGFALSW